jgi:osmotically-inducible protein OsmY
LRILFPASVSIAITGCVPIIIGTGITTGGYVAVRDKKVGDTITDTKIEAALKKRLYVISAQLYSDVSVVSDHGYVLLTGNVHNPDWINIAEREAWATDGVVGVDNCLSSGEEITVAQAMKDGLITSSCRTSILCDSSIKSVNYKIKTMNGTVYLLGVARSEDELGLVLSKIQSVSGVKKIISYVSLQPKKRIQ